MRPARAKRAYNRRIQPEAQMQATAIPADGPQMAAEAPQLAEPLMAPNMGRPAMRPADPRSNSMERANLRAQQLLGDIDINNARDRFDAPPPPEGWTYEWKSVEVLGREDPQYQTELSRTGWEEVDAARHPEMMPRDWKGPIRRDGMVLMERPAQITAKVKERDQREANHLVQSVKERMGESKPGQFERADGRGQSTASVKTSWAPPIQVPADS